MTARRGHALLILDDAQGADASSLRLVHHLVRSAPSAPLLVVAPARREDCDVGRLLVDFTTALQSQGRCAEIGIGRLDRAETALLAERFTGAPLDPTARRRLHHDSEGDPLFVVAALRPDAPADAPKVQAVTAGRLARLSRPAAAPAGVAAASGGAFTVGVRSAA